MKSAIIAINLCLVLCGYVAALSTKGWQYHAAASSVKASTYPFCENADGKPVCTVKDCCCWSTMGAPQEVKVNALHHGVCANPPPGFDYVAQPGTTHDAGVHRRIEQRSEPVLEGRSLCCLQSLKNPIYFSNRQMRKGAEKEKILLLQGPASGESPVEALPTVAQSAVPTDDLTDDSVALADLVTLGTRDLEESRDAGIPTITNSHELAYEDSVPKPPVNVSGAANSPPEAVLLAATKDEAGRLMNFLEKPGEVDRRFNFDVFKERFPTQEHFMPSCLAHVHRLVNRIDLSYTDQQLETVLATECWMTDKFDTVYVDTFDRRKDCKHFAESLIAAREEELKTTKIHKYNEFCKEYYVFQRNGGTFRKRAESSAASTAPGLLAVVTAGLLALRQ